MGNMFKTTKAKSVTEYIGLVDEPRRTEMKQLHRLITKTVPKLKPFLITGMIGYGKYHYKYPSGREGDWATIALANQKNYISVYVCAVDAKGYVAERRRKELPKASIGKSCIRFKRIADIDLKTLASIIKEGAKSPMGAV
jgi:hypothetical protein